MKADVVVLGAGIVGLSTAIHLARRGKSVLLVDRRGVGEETSFGNAGLIQREGVVPYGFPHDFGALFRYALNNTIDAHYHVKALPGLVPFLIRYWWNSGFTQHQRIARLYAPLIENSITEHDDLIKASGADNLIQRDGWMKVFRTEKARDEAYREAERLSAGFGVHHQKLSSSEIKTIEPSIRAELAGGLRWSDPWSIRDPHSLNKAYLSYFQSLGGQIVAGDAATLEHVLEGPGWRVASPDGPIEAMEVVVALGPWADTVTRKLGYRFPLAVKRGYHMHYGSQEGAQLNNWVLDAEKGYFLAPMLRGIRLTTGAEFATRDAPKTPVQLDRAERVAREFYPLAERRDPEPWMGARPCTPDMMPIIGKAPRHQGLWFAFGHAHHGMTLGPVTGRALAELMTGDRTVVDLGPYRPERFLA
ncbi:FAD-binding oxidoreductase [Rhizobium sp. CC-YZS058]|uniref:NAD(P)/FAD-dependent oxidoreductase n=1 Tax=Rhizobium sp. CC-YZS058 TaxID=3042153 RepID=UPI002B05C612|nr:FAD-binding oxidoreductase [Rhizobium sp. CC-YZS058]MEA3535970.1 FAD-binding oxidoreductase [Rhizobium sp. CC-YZS058]